MDLIYAKQIAIRAAYTAGRILNEHFGHLTQVNKKGDIDLVTAADLASEKAVLAVIREAFPEHALLAEESGASPTDSDYTWIVDPLDGTTNFVHGLPIFAVSIACRHLEEVVVGVVFNPVNGELFCAVRGQGATLNDRRITVSQTDTLRESLLVTGFPYDLSGKAHALLRRFHDCLMATRGIRRLGSAALDLCFVACGRFDGFWEENLKPWDTAAGMLIAVEAGGQVSDFRAGAYRPGAETILATNGRIHAALAGLLSKDLE
jgi:myo-inositol-1(or 4)-monophosphatase